MRTWFLPVLFLAGFGACPTDSGPDSGSDRGGDCRRALDAWCGAPLGPTPETCPAPSIDEVLAQDAYYIWQESCDDPEHGLLDVVGVSDGVTVEEWYFDADGELVAYVYGTDYGLCAAAASTQPSTSTIPSQLVYGFLPSCGAAR